MRQRTGRDERDTAEGRREKFVLLERNDIVPENC